jgi:GDP-mannose 6-dehydrogenase
MKISIFGLGYVGTVAIGCFAKAGHEGIGVDINEDKIELINSGQSPIVEAQLNELISEGRKNGRITATNDSIQAVCSSDVSFICVGTPSTLEGHLDLSYLEKVSKEIAEGLRKKNGFHVVCIRSTVPPGTCERISILIEEYSGKIAEKDFTVVSNPEFLREGSAVVDFNDPPFTLIGSRSSKATQMLKVLYGHLPSPFVTTEVRTAEMLKYVNNTFHALKITFANEVGNICKKLGIDSRELMRIFCMDNKLNISSYYLNPGFAYGGSCLPKDLKALRTMAHDLYVRCPVIESIEISNEMQKDLVLNKIIEFGKNKVGFLGLSFKAGTDDLRNSPIIDVIEKLLGKGFDVRIYDRNVNLSNLLGSNREFIRQKIPFVSRFISERLEQVIEHSDVIVLVNKEREFITLLENNFDGKIVYDLVNIGFNREKQESNYVGISW